MSCCETIWEDNPYSGYYITRCKGYYAEQYYLWEFGSEIDAVSLASFEADDFDHYIGIWKKAKRELMGSQDFFRLSLYMSII